MEEPKIIAVRNGKTREFTRKMWDLIGTDKYGWVPVEQTTPPPVPKEVAQTVGNIADILSNTPAPATSKRKKK